MPASSRTTGLIVAVVLLVVFAGVVTFFVVRAPSGAGQVNTFSGPAPTPDPKLVAAKGAEGAPVNRTGEGRGFFIQVVDKDDPTAVRAELSAERSRPIEGQTYRVALEKPVVWVFLKDGRTIYARADKGTAYVPDQSKGLGARPSMPQDGVMEGNVLVKVFDEREGNLRPNPVEDEALLTGTTSQLRFDSELGQAEAPQQVQITARGVEFRGAGVTVVFNEPQQRMELLHVARTEFVTVRPWELEEDKKPTKSAPAGDGVKREVAGKGEGAKAAPAPAARKPIETLYRLVCTDGVTVTQGTRVVTGEQLEGWARLVNNQLRPGAVVTSNAGPRPAGAASGASAAGSRQAGASSGSGAARTAGQGAPEGGSLLAADSETPVTLAWKGPLEVRPLTAKASELDFNDVFVRFTSKSPTGVGFRDSKAKATAAGNVLEYGATRREVGLAGVGEQGARIALEGSGDAKAERFDMSLVTGVARVHGPGLLTGTSKSGTRTFAWKKEGQFQFGKDSKGEVTERLEKVTASGASRAVDGSGSLNGEMLVAAFVPVDAKRSRLSTLTVVGRARAESEGDSLEADKLDIAFVPGAAGGDDVDPRTVVADGAVKGTRKEKGKTSTLAASWLEATIERVNDSRGKPVLNATSVKARETVFARDDGLRAKAPVMSAQPVAGVARLTGAAGTVSVGNADSTMTGQDMTFHDAERRLLAVGPGTLVHNAVEKGGKPASRVTASWTTEMTFDDVSGVVTCKGDAVAELSKTRQGVLVERDTMTAADVVLQLTAGSASASADQPGGDRELRSAVIRGAGAGKEATVESRLFASGGAAGGAAGGQPKLERLMYLRSDRIALDMEKGTLEVPTPGKLLFVDNRAAEQGAPAKLLDDPAGARGRALFSWAGSMSFVRPKGVVTMRENVRLDHRRSEQEPMSELECEVLVANVREQGGTRAADAQEFQGELVSADAEGAVWMKYAGRELVADKAHYDAQGRKLRALALGENKVQVFGGDAPSGSMQDITWDLAKDTIEITKPGTVTAPRR
ncbi:MAG TPA: hypothetical protein VD997_11935 [Phycisphaerales bacterium]|nr:hypothetical protein [Phycisphaerales bacterium]